MIKMIWKVDAEGHTVGHWTDRDNRVSQKKNLTTVIQQRQTTGRQQLKSI